MPLNSATVHAYQCQVSGNTTEFIQKCCHINARCQEYTPANSRYKHTYTFTKKMCTHSHVFIAANNHLSFHPYVRICNSCLKCHPIFSFIEISLGKWTQRPPPAIRLESLVGTAATTWVVYNGILNIYIYYTLSYVNVGWLFIAKDPKKKCEWNKIILKVSKREELQNYHL